jgi:hypothetical protein
VTRPGRTGAERVRAVEAKRPAGPRTLAIVGGSVPMTTDLADAIRAAIDAQRERERKQAP